MLTPSACFTCGGPLGDVAPIYHWIRRKRMLERYGREDPPVAPTQAGVDPGQGENIMGDVLEALRINECCVTHLTTAVLLVEHY